MVSKLITKSLPKAFFQGFSWQLDMVIFVAVVACALYLLYASSNTERIPVPDVHHQGLLLSRLKHNVHLNSPDCPDRHDLRGVYIGKFVSCYDGDTCDVVLLIPSDAGNGQMRMIRYRARTMGYNAPEIKQPKDEVNRDQLKKMAVNSRDALWQMLSGGTQNSAHQNLMAVSCHGFDKYGRLLVQIWPLLYNEQSKTWYYDSSRESINQRMLNMLGPEYAMDDKGRMIANLTKDNNKAPNGTKSIT